MKQIETRVKRPLIARTAGAGGYSIFRIAFGRLQDTAVHTNLTSNSAFVRVVLGREVKEVVGIIGRKFQFPGDFEGIRVVVGSLFCAARFVVVSQIGFVGRTADDVKDVEGGWCSGNWPAGGRCR